ncbi:Thaumatin [Macleaya cordata]|uniref:Thaumatin n=1 Tax=Macleaya cordata TaxID=56857 RepID=A0A200RCD0_MACCD|nr:Thaumatin [Macleaya cordata]
MKFPTSLCLFSFLLQLFISLSFSNGIQLILVNNCRESIWPGVLGSVGHSSLGNGGFHLNFGEEVVINVPDRWSGRIWGRQGCSFNKDGVGSCNTGDCAGLLHCKGAAGVPPATVVEMTLGTSNSPLH